MEGRATNFHGVDDAFVRAVGNCTLAGTALEAALLRLAIAAARLGGDTRTNQELARTWGPKPGTTLVKQVRESLAVPAQHRVELGDFLDQVDAALQERHDVVHNYWVMTAADDTWWGHRNPTGKNKSLKFVATTAGGIEDVWREMDDLRKWADVWASRLHD